MITKIARYGLMIFLVLLGLGGLIEGTTLLTDPGGAEMGSSARILGNLPIIDFVIPGLLLIAIMGVSPLVITYGIWQRLSWAWAAALVQSVLLILWLGLQILLWGTPILNHLVYLICGVLLVILCLLPGARLGLEKPTAPPLQREPDLIELEAQFTKDTDPERAKNRQFTNTLRSGRG
ncbi:hypothetical protein [Bellilinea sp.]|uniref:hypothetical protein n=1 Tax=Bellilinea sp. TaxID=2838785 RepID=UPI002ADE1789|nr:hypothetical protein [Bellilinea sp.]